MLMGDTARDAVWKNLAEMLAETWTHASGRGDAVGALCLGYRVCHAGGLRLCEGLPRFA